LKKQSDSPKWSFTCSFGLGSGIGWIVYCCWHCCWPHWEKSADGDCDSNGGGSIASLTAFWSFRGVSRRKSMEMDLRLRVAAELVTESPAPLLVTGLRLLLLSRNDRSLGFMIYLLV
jgi:hypothetical protein